MNKMQTTMLFGAESLGLTVELGEWLSECRDEYKEIIYRPIR